MRDMAKKIPPDMAELSVYVDKKLKLQFKLACTAQEKPMSEVVGLLMKQWLETEATSPESEPQRFKTAAKTEETNAERPK